MMPVVMGSMQFFIHGIAMNVRVGSVYNPVRSTDGGPGFAVSRYGGRDASVGRAVEAVGVIAVPLFF